MYYVRYRYVSDNYRLKQFNSYHLETDIVFAIADMLGPNEDFDGLVTSLEDYSMGY